MGQSVGAEGGQQHERHRQPGALLPVPSTSSYQRLSHLAYSEPMLAVTISCVQAGQDNGSRTYRFLMLFSSSSKLVSNKHNYDARRFIKNRKNYFLDNFLVVN